MLQWQKIADRTYQLIVEGGYLIRYDHIEGVAMIFVPQKVSDG